jgi:hypothetical protein
MKVVTGYSPGGLLLIPWHAQGICMLEQAFQKYVDSIGQVPCSETLFALMLWVYKAWSQPSRGYMLANFFC